MTDITKQGDARSNETTLNDKVQEKTKIVELQSLIDQQWKNGYREGEITDILKERGFSEGDIAMGFEKYQSYLAQESTRRNESLEDWVTEKFAEGKNESWVRKKLEEKGWSKEVVDEAIKEVQSKVI